MYRERGESVVGLNDWCNASHLVCHLSYRAWGLGRAGVSIVCSEVGRPSKKVQLFKEAGVCIYLVAVIAV